MARLLGRQKPTHWLVPEYDETMGPLAVEIAEMAGLKFDPWQKAFMRDGMGLVDDRWAAFEVAIELSRQNGKSVCFEARCLAGLYVLREKLIVYTAHKGETAMEAFRRIDDLIDSDGELRAEVAFNGVRRANGKESITLKSGQMIKFRTRTSGGGRGLSGDCVILDEAQDLDDDEISALMPVMSARSMTGNPQIWYGGSAGGHRSVVLGRLVRRCDATESDLMMYRWAASEDDDPSSKRTWAKVNPAAGRRISLAHIAKEHRAMAPDRFARERLGIGDYPREEGEEWVIPASRWEQCTDPDAEPAGPLVFSVDVKPDQSWSSISVAGKSKPGPRVRRARGRDVGRYGEVIENARGTRWVVPMLADLVRKNPDYLGIIVDPAGPAGSLLGEMADHGLKVTTTTAGDMAKACGWLYGACMADEPEFWHRGAPVLTAALASAAVRNLQDAWAWRRQGASDISPLVSVTLAAHGLSMLARRRPTPPSPRKARSRGDSPARTETRELASAGF